VKLANRLKYFVAALLMIVAFGFAMFRNHDLFLISNIPLEFSNHQADEALKERLQNLLSGFTNRRIWEIDISEMRASILSDQWVSSVQVTRFFPNFLHVTVNSKEPLLIWVGPKGELIPVAEDASLLGVVPIDRLIDAPLLRGEIFSGQAGNQKRQKATKFVLGLPLKGPLSRRNISELTWTPEYGFELTLINPKVEIRLGDDPPSFKIARTTQVLNYLANNHLKSRVIDASFSKKVLVRLRKAP
jgi:cell division septal protein FtsQ